MGDGVAPPGVALGVGLGATVTVGDGAGEESAALPHDTNATLSTETMRRFTESIMRLLWCAGIRALPANAYARRKT
jgi:hypothetical protein